MRLPPVRRCRVSIDRTPKPCHHKKADHQHGTRITYKADQCRCLPCSKANSAYERVRNKQKAYGRWQPYVDAAPARAHVQQLLAAGLGWKRIAMLADLPQSSLSNLLYGHEGRPRSKRIRVETERRILTVRAGLDTLGRGVRVDGTGTRRRLQALVTIGWSKAKLGERLGMTPGNFGRTFGSDRVFAGTARAVRDLYDELWDRPPAEVTASERRSAARARNQAARAGWAPPLAWDDETIDDPSATPTVGEATRRDLLEDLQWLLDNGCSYAEALARLGVKSDAVEQARRRRGRRAA